MLKFNLEWRPSPIYFWFVFFLYISQQVSTSNLQTVLSLHAGSWQTEAGESWTGSRPSCSPWNELVMEGSKTKAIMLQALAASCRCSPDTYLFRSDSARVRLLYAFNRGGRSWKLSGMQLKAKWKTHTHKKKNRLPFPCANGSSVISPLLYRSAVHHPCSVQPPEQSGRAVFLL